MLLIVIMLSLVMSHFLVQNLIGTIGDVLGQFVAAGVVLVAYVAMILLFGKVCADLSAPVRRVTISFVYGALLAVFFSAFAALRSALIDGQIVDKGVVVLLIALFLSWGALAHVAVGWVFTPIAREEYWSYIKRKYSTFRNSGNSGDT